MNKNEIIKNVTASATGLRRMANSLQESRKTKGNVIVDVYITTSKENNKIRKVLGIEI